MKHGIVISSLMLAGCATPPPAGPVAPPGWVHAPTNGGSLSGSWWRNFDDPKLDSLVRQAWENNADIEVAQRRVESARADHFEAMAMLFPKAGVALGFREGREQNSTTGFRPMDLEPWAAEGGISWELDVTGRLGARVAAAKSREAAAYARWQGVRLMVATELSAARFEEALLHREVRTQGEQLAVEKRAADLTKELLDRGLVSSAEHAARVGALESLQREISELERLRDKARIRITRLLGGGSAPTRHSGQVRLPETPTRVPAAVWQSRPDMIAAEAEVRSAFAMQDAARLDLLPSLSLGAGGGFANSSLRGDFTEWQGSVGPSLEIPIWDPARIAAVKRSSAEAAKASARFRSTADKAIEEIESANVDLKRFRTQLGSLEREAETRHRAWQDAKSKVSSGTESAIAIADQGRAYHDTSALATRMKLRALNAHLRLIRALGG